MSIHHSRACRRVTCRRVLDVLRSDLYTLHLHTRSPQ
jgi:hypothetical protein